MLSLRLVRGKSIRLNHMEAWYRECCAESKERVLSNVSGPSYLIEGREERRPHVRLKS